MRGHVAFRSRSAIPRHRQHRANPAPSIILGSIIAYTFNTKYGSTRSSSAFWLAGFLRPRRARLSGLSPVVRKKRGQDALRGLASSSASCSSPRSRRPLFRGRLPLRRGSLYRADAPFGIINLPLRLLVRASFRSPCSGLQLSDQDLHRTGDHGGGAGSARAAMMAANPSASNRSRLRFRSPPADRPAPASSSFSRFEPSVGRDYIGPYLAICVLGGLGSLPGALIAAMLLGIIESLTSTFYDRPGLPRRLRTSAADTCVEARGLWEGKLCVLRFFFSCDPWWRGGVFRRPLRAQRI